MARPWLIAPIIVAAEHAVPFFLRSNSEWDQTYIGAARLMVAGGELIRAKYTYPPFMAWLVIPLSDLPLWVGRAALLASCLTGVAVMYALAGKMAGVDLSVRVNFWREWIAAWLVFACVGRFAATAFSYQQPEAIVGALTVGGAFLVFRDRAMAAATSLGAAAAMKCTALLWCLYLPFRGGRLAALWLVIAAVGLNLLPDLFYTPAAGGTWLGNWGRQALSPMTAADYGPGQWPAPLWGNQSVGALLNRLLTKVPARKGGVGDLIEREGAMSPAALRTVVIAADLLLLAAAAWAMGRGRTRTSAGDTAGSAAGVPRCALEFSLVLTLMPLLSPMSSRAHFAVLVLPAWCLAREAAWGGIGPRVFVAAALVLSVAGMPALGGGTKFQMSFFGTTTWAALALFAGCVHQLLVRPCEPAGETAVAPETAGERAEPAAG